MVKNVVAIRDEVKQRFEQTNAKYKAVADKHHELKYFKKKILSWCFLGESVSLLKLTAN